MANKNENDKKMEYLRREEVKTMKKDVQKLREAEAQKERERIAQLRAEEEKRREEERLARAKEEAEARKRAEETASTKATATKEAIRSAIEKEATIKKEEVEIAEEKRKKLGEKLRETQVREEEERKKFLERVAAKAEGREPEPTPSRPASPPISSKEPGPPREAPTKKPKVGLPRIAKSRLPKVSGIFPKKPSVMNKVWVRILILLLVFGIWAAVATFWYWYFAVRGEEPIPEQSAEPMEETEKPPQEPVEPEVIMPEINEIILGFGYRIPQSPRTIDTIVIHTVYNTLGDDVHSLKGVLDEYEMYGVAAHYLIDRDGTVYQTAPEEAIAYHAGVSQMPDGRTNVNNFSIGIEAISHKDNTLTEEQYISLAGLVKHLKEKYRVPDENIVGHSDIAPDRKTDPWNFDWEYFRSLID